MPVAFTMLWVQLYIYLKAAYAAVAQPIRYYLLYRFQIMTPILR